MARLLTHDVVLADPAVDVIRAAHLLHVLRYGKAVPLHSQEQK